MSLSLIIVLSGAGLLLFSSGVLWFRHYSELVTLRERLSSKDQEIRAHEERLTAVKTEMKATFSQAAQEALKGSNEEFLKLAELTLSKQQQVVKSNLEEKKNEINHLVKPLQESLKTFQTEVSTMEKERQRAYALVENELKRVTEQSASLSKETRALKNALKKPHIRGRWGEVQLKNCVELAGMSEFSDFTTQDVSDADGKKLIPDLTVKMPGGRIVVVDAKTPIDAFLTSLEKETESEKQEAMANHGRQVKDHILKLSRKDYSGHLEKSADFTVMFLPNESFLYAALETQADLVEFALNKKILIATPPTFVGLLKVIRFGWNEERLNQNAEEISKVGKELHKRVVDFLEAYMDMGSSLKQAQDRYQMGLQRLNSRVLVQARKMEDLGAKSHKSLPNPDL